MEDLLREAVFKAIASLSSVGADGFDDSAQLTKPPLNLTGAGLTVLALKLTQLSAARGGSAITIGEIRGARTVGRCVQLVREKAAR